MPTNKLNQQSCTMNVTYRPMDTLGVDRGRTYTIFIHVATENVSRKIIRRLVKNNEGCSIEVMSVLTRNCCPDRDQPSNLYNQDII